MEIDMQIRKATEFDIGKIAHIHVTCWREVYSFMPEFIFRARNYEYREAQWLKIIRDIELKEGLFVLNDSASAVVGFCYCCSNEDAALKAAGELHAAYILPQHRGGIAGPMMMLTMLDALSEKGLSPTGLWAFDDNRIQKWYRLMGWRSAVKRHRFIAGFEFPETGFLCPDEPRLRSRLKRIISARLS